MLCCTIGVADILAHLSDSHDQHTCLLVGSAALLQALPNLNLERRGSAALAALRRAAQLLHRNHNPALAALRKLDLGQNNCGAGGAAALAAVLPQLPALQQLNLRGNIRGETTLEVKVLQRWRLRCPIFDS